MKKIGTQQQGFAFLTVLLVLLVATTAAGAYTLVQRRAVEENDIELSRATSLPTNLGETLTAAKLSELVLAEKPEAVIAAVELEQEDEGLLYKVVLNDGSVLFYDAKTGAKVNRTAANESLSDDDRLPASFVASINFADAVAKAKATYGDKPIKAVKLEMEDGKVVYSVRFRDGGRVDIDAASGDITRQKSGDDDKNDESSNNSDDSNKDSDDSKDSDDHEEEDTEDDGDRSGDDSNDDDDSDDDSDDDDEDDDNRSGSNSGSGNNN